MKRTITWLIFFFLCHPELSAQSVDNASSPSPSYRIMFYNVENFFDADTDTTRTYNEFTPGGDLHWTPKKVVAKRNALYKVITAVGGWSPPAIIGMAEVENRRVLEQLINQTPLNKHGYKIIHYDSPDFRGIDAAILYSPAFTLLHAQRISVTDPDDSTFKTRDMVYAKGLLKGDTLHFIVNHWTSRYRGLLESLPKRILQARQLLRVTDSICTRNPEAHIILTGDFNDSPADESMQLLVEPGHACTFINLPMKATNKNVLGTLKYQGHWSVFDQMLVTKNLLEESGKLSVVEGKGVIFSESFILEKDKKFGGYQPYRTNIGFTYHGGFADHLPVYIDLKNGK